MHLPITAAAAQTLMPTIRDTLKTAEATLLLGPHPDRASRDAESLLLHLLQKNRAWLLANQDSVPDPATQSRYRDQITRRHSGEPTQYITGHTEFFGLPFQVTPDVLIPRPETEHLVEAALHLLSDHPRPTIADLGTGSGIIAIALAHSLPGAQITATDLSPTALEIARQNAQLNQVHDRISFLVGDLFSPLAGRQFNLIVSNPPYIPAVDLPSLSVEVRDHEPHSALFAGTDGLQIYQRLIPATVEHLNEDGWLLLEIGYGQQPAIASLLQSSRYREIRFLPDYQGIPRVATGLRPRS